MSADLSTNAQSFEPGQSAFEAAKAFVDDDDEWPEWGHLHLAVQQHWAKVEKNFSDNLLEPIEASWDHYAAMALDSLMPTWDALDYSQRRMWQLAFTTHQYGHAPKMPAATEGDAMEELRKMRSYSKCFTTAYDRKQGVFVLIEQDKTAWKCIAQWVVLNVTRLTERHVKIISAKATLAKFKETAETTGKDAD